MIYSRAAEYAIRACVALAQVPDEQYVLVKDLASQEDIPQPFLGKILQELARKGYLRSSKGPRGGFALRVAPGELRLLDIVETLDGIASYPQCTSGFPECTEENPCPIHETWVTLHAQIIDYLARNNIAQLVRASERRRRSAAAKRRRATAA